MKLALTLALSSSLTLFACAENGRAESPQQGKPDVQTSQDPTNQAQILTLTDEMNVRNYGDETGGDSMSFNHRFTPASQFKDVPDQDIKALFDSPTINTASLGSYTIKLRNMHDAESCKSYSRDYETLLLRPNETQIGPEYLPAFTDTWHNVRFTRNVHFGALSGILLNQDEDVVGYLEQSQKTWSGGTPRVAISSISTSGEVSFDTLSILPDMVAEAESYSDKVVTGTERKNMWACFPTDKLNLRAFLDAYSQDIIDVVETRL